MMTRFLNISALHMFLNVGHSLSPWQGHSTERRKHRAAAAIKRDRWGGTDGCSRRKASLVFTWVINPSLNDIIQSKSAGRLFAPQILVHGRSQDLGHMIVVFAEVRILLIRSVFHLHRVVRVTERHGCSLGGGWKEETMKSSEMKRNVERAQSASTVCTKIIVYVTF